jgi:hypothetical protein
MVLWGLTGDTIDGRLVTMAAQAGTTALRDAMDGLGFRFKYVYDTPGDTRNRSGPDRSIWRRCAGSRACCAARGLEWSGSAI